MKHFGWIKINREWWEHQSRTPPTFAHPTWPRRSVVSSLHVQFPCLAVAFDVRVVLGQLVLVAFAFHWLQPLIAWRWPKSPPLCVLCFDQIRFFARKAFWLSGNGVTLKTLKLRSGNFHTKPFPICSAHRVIRPHPEILPFYEQPSPSLRAYSWES